MCIIIAKNICYIYIIQTTKYNSLQVSIKGTRITRIQAFILLYIKTVSLDIRHNKISKIHPKTFWTSKSNNRTTHTKLIDLKLINNTIKHIESGTFDPLINLEHLDLSDNKLSNIDNTLIINLSKLIHLKIENNKLTQLPTKWLPGNLKILFMRNNQLEYLSNYTFEGTFILEEITFHLNNINIKYNTFTRLTKLKKFDIFDSRLHGYMPIKALPRCTCTFIWYLYVIDTRYDYYLCGDFNPFTEYGVRKYLENECQVN